MKFSKYHGTGNDFVMIQDLEGRLALDSTLVSALCDRHMGIGADGLIRIAPSDTADFFMDYWNADGQVAEMCGNGIRCLAKYVFDRGLTQRSDVDVDTRDGVKHVLIDVADGMATSVRVDMGPPAFERKLIPMTGPPNETYEEQPFSEGGLDFRGTAVSMGNPHLVLIGDADPASIDVRGIGPRLEAHPDFPERTNVEFVRVRDGGVDVRVWERGVGETMACGTGACASLVASAQAGLVDRDGEVRFPGGTLRVEWAEEGSVHLEGPATFVFDGELTPAWIAAVGVDDPWA
ncbi:MAG TPA: diaminopimelate epimerase [Actinomycetota bacterium]|jgi:diaminopimelate epimerase|nr:diaminopimelate epimerase [Actinomycetota bacterium]